VVNTLGRAANVGVTDAHALRQLARRTSGKWVSGNYRRPVIIPVVVEV
jgi:ribonuclease J